MGQGENEVLWNWQRIVAQKSSGWLLYSDNLYLYKLQLVCWNTSTSASYCVNEAGIIIKWAGNCTVLYCKTPLLRNCFSKWTSWQVSNRLQPELSSDNGISSRHRPGWYRKEKMKRWNWWISLNSWILKISSGKVIYEQLYVYVQLYIFVCSTMRIVQEQFIQPDHN